MKKHLRTHFFAQIAQIAIMLYNNRRIGKRDTPKGNLFLFIGTYSLKNKNQNLEK